VSIVVAPSPAPGRLVLDVVDEEERIAHKLAGVLEVPCERFAATAWKR